MDQHRFDALARAVAGKASRRGLLRGLTPALALLALGRQSSIHAAPSGYLGPGEACTDSSQCGDTRYSQMFCDDNGMSNDGSLNCCTYEYGYCYDDDGCCGSLVCEYGSCSQPGLADLPLGAQYFTVDQCLDQDNGIICGNNGGFVPACCVQGGFTCTDDLDCCMPNNCVGGICQ